MEIENVPDICKHPDVVASIIDSLSEQGYWVRRYPLLASEYGVPQARTRFFIVASLLGPLEAPLPTTKGALLTVVNAIGRAAFSHAPDELMLTEAEKMRAERLDIMSDCQRFRELHADEPARTLTATNLANKHGNMLRLRLEDSRLRRPSVQEAAQLQSFPDDARFEPHVISERQAYIGIGNAVPPELGRHLAAAADSASE